PDKRHDLIHVPNSSFIYDYSLNNQNYTFFGVVFDIKKDNDVTNFRYQVWYNSTINYNQTDPFGSRVSSVVRGLDEAIMTYANNNPNIQASVDIDLKDFPTIALQNLDDAAVSMVGSVFFFCSAMVIFINSLNTIVTEKENKIRYCMEMMGLYKSVYWLSWFIVYFVLILINSLCTIFFGMIFQYSVFINTNFIVLFLLFFGYGIGMITLGFFLTTFVNSSRIFVLIIGFLFQSFVFSNGYLAYLWWSTSVPQLFRYLFSFLPFFNFGRIYYDIAQLSGSSINIITGMTVSGKGFKLSDLSKIPETSISYILDLDYLDAPINSVLYYLINIILYSILTLYFDNIIPNEFGNCQSFYYFLLPSYWGLSKSDNNSNEWVKNVLNKYPATYNKEKVDSDVLEHINHTCDPSNNDPIKVVNLKKKYGKGKNEKVVVNGSYLSLTKDRGKLNFFLTQNGAGKSTTINIMAGLTPPTSGDVSVFGKTLTNDINGVQRELGICPQHDILYPDMTAMEHLLLYTGLKGVTTENLDKILEERLKAVKLWTVKDARTNTYSGGMKRRLSMIIATIGDPNVILLDEPTTGMDPLNRRHVWRFIEKFKKNRCIVVTTHSMEEADALGDEIIIMSNGDIKAIGNGVHLKNKFGTGYHISMIAKEKKIDEIKNKVQEFVPGAKLEDDSAGALIYNFTKEQLQYIPEFIKYLDDNPDNLISNWGISQTTLEEVFLLVIQDSSNRKTAKN
ncbi:P-loop containing nucleoside triphosphate hydrolase protein, partial [Anaeromyces robustus]